MDKFGIFKLLNSFLNLSPNNEGGSTDNSTNASQENSDLLGGLFSSLKSANQALAPQNANPQIKPAPTKPLQLQMLNTISDHEKILNRVKNKTH